MVKPARALSRKSHPGFSIIPELTAKKTSSSGIWCRAPRRSGSRYRKKRKSLRPSKGRRLWKASAVPPSFIRLATDLENPLRGRTSAATTGTVCRLSPPHAMREAIFRQTRTGLTAAAQRRVHLASSPVCTKHRLSVGEGKGYYSSSLPLLNLRLIIEKTLDDCQGF